jgi:hypothetical protein
MVKISFVSSSLREGLGNRNYIRKYTQRFLLLFSYIAESAVLIVGFSSFVKSNIDKNLG